MKFLAPEGCTGISVGGEQFNVDENGHIEVPDSGDYAALLAPHGFKPVPPARQAEATAKAGETQEGGETAPEAAPEVPAAAAEAKAPEADAAQAEATAKAGKKAK